MTYTPNYLSPSWDEYMNLLCWEARLAQEIELHIRRRNWHEVAVLKREKQKVAIRRKCLKAALQHKRNTGPITI